jgi:hypothetical protein
MSLPSIVVKVNLWFDRIFGLAIILVQPGHIDLDIKVADITNDGLVLHSTEMFFRDQVAAA